MSALPNQVRPLEGNPNVVKVNSSQSLNAMRAGFLARAAAMTIDGLIVLFASFPIQLIATMVFRQVMGIHNALDLYHHRYAGALLNLSVVALVIYLYYGYFYSSRGATPGKTLMGLKVTRARNGKYLNYTDAFLREFLGKTILETCTLGIGYLLAAVRKDRLALHDIIFETRVLKQKNQ